MSEAALALGLFPAIGIFIVFLALAAVIFAFAKYCNKLFSAESAVDEKYYAYEEGTLDKVATKNGLDLNKIILKRESREYPASLRRKIREQMVKELDNSK